MFIIFGIPISLLISIAIVVDSAQGTISIDSLTHISLDILVALPSPIFLAIIIIAIRSLHDPLELVGIVFTLHQLEYHFLLRRAQAGRSRLLHDGIGILLIHSPRTVIPTMIVVPQHVPHLLHPSLQLVPPRVLQSPQLLLLGPSLGCLTFLPSEAFQTSRFVLPAEEVLVGRGGGTRVVDNAVGRPRGGCSCRGARIVSHRLLEAEVVLGLELVHSL
mmetsp:Transcript_12234/g.29894  ORF Transcript_12234/g.29894 Transcript_12234/m.29894 type:complete len:218 (+) Transcript_12234:1385-2038(+)